MGLPAVLERFKASWAELHGSIRVEVLCRDLRYERPANDAEAAIKSEYDARLKACEPEMVYVLRSMESVVRLL